MKAIILERDSRNGAYADVIDACAALKKEYGSATNAAAMLIRSSPLFRRAMRELRRRRGAK